MERIDRIEKAIEELVASQKVTDARLNELTISVKELTEWIERDSRRIEKLPTTQKSADTRIKEINQPQAMNIESNNAVYALDLR